MFISNSKTINSIKSTLEKNFKSRIKVCTTCDSEFYCSIIKPKNILATAKKIIKLVSAKIDKFYNFSIQIVEKYDTIDVSVYFESAHLIYSNIEKVEYNPAENSLFLIGHTLICWKVYQYLINHPIYRIASYERLLYCKSLSYNDINIILKYFNYNKMPKKQYNIYKNRPLKYKEDIIEEKFSYVVNVVKKVFGKKIKNIDFWSIYEPTLYLDLKIKESDLINITKLLVNKFRKLKIDSEYELNLWYDSTITNGRLAIGWRKTDKVRYKALVSKYYNNQISVIDTYKYKNDDIIIITKCIYGYINGYVLTSTYYLKNAMKYVLTDNSIKAFVKNFNFKDLNDFLTLYGRRKISEKTYLKHLLKST